MSAQAKKKTRWWVIILFIPLLVSCSSFTPVAKELWKISLRVGDFLIKNRIGQVIERSLERAIDKIMQEFFERRVCDIIPLRNNPLEGISTCEMEFINGENGKICKIKNLKVYRESENSNEWHESTSMRRIIDEQLR